MAENMRLLLLIGGILPERAPHEVIEALQSVSVHTGTGEQGGFQLSFAVSKRSALTTTLLPMGYFDPGRRVVIATIIRGEQTVVMDGIITRQEVGPSDTPGASTLTVTGLDMTAVFDMVHVEFIWPELPYFAQVELICLKHAMYGIAPIAVPSVFNPVEPAVRRNGVQSDTDLEYIKYLATRAGHVFFIEPGPEIGTNIAYWGPEARFGLMQPALSVNMGAASNTESMSFAFDGLSATQYSIIEVEPHTGIGFPIPIPDVSLLRPPLAARPALKLKHQKIDFGANKSLPEGLLYGLAHSAKSLDAISGQGKLDVLRYGHVLKARRLVGVRGVGAAYDGLYFVTKVTHEIKRGEYKQSFSLSRDGLLPLLEEVSV
ncbi:hypothetical protein ACFWY9_33310 [Amycolatopsis sp. NPDC059027]|uniref:hypothetical protein n=1 Tax=unclassified Amycolatopsis TaxID=2618356 RepID=UPI00367029C7